MGNSRGSKTMHLWKKPRSKWRLSHFNSSVIVRIHQVIQLIPVRCGRNWANVITPTDCKDLCLWSQVKMGRMKKMLSLSEKNNEKQKSETLQKKKKKKKRNLTRHNGNEGKQKSYCWWIAGQEVYLTRIFFQYFLCLSVNIERFKNVQQWWDIFKGSYFGKGHCFSNNAGCEQNAMLPLRASKLYFAIWQNYFTFTKKFLFFTKVSYSRIWLYCGSGTREKKCK